MSNRGEFRPFPPAGADALPGHRDPDSYFYVAHGADCVLLCEYGDVARYKNGAVFPPDEARRLGRDSWPKLTPQKAPPNPTEKERDYAQAASVDAVGP